MISIASKPAFPVQTLTLTQDGNYRDLSAYGDTNQPGLTFRQLAAIHIAQGLAAYGGFSPEYGVERAVRWADLLAAELAKDPS